jgi:uncharacterized protein (TIGR03083 family)
MAYRSLERPDRDQVVATMTVLADRVASLMDAVTDWDARVYGSDSWTVTDLVRHLSLLPEHYAPTSVEVPLAMAPAAGAMAETNAKNLAATAHRTRAELPAIFRRNVPLLLERLRSSDPQEPLPWHAGLTLTPGELGAIAIGEWLVHGWELARTIGAPWQVEPEPARLVLAGFNAVLPVWLDAGKAAGHSGRYEIRLRGAGERLQWTFVDGDLTTRPPGGAAFRPDTIIWAEPSALLLYLYRRTDLWSNVLRGNMLAGGRRPVRALTLRALFHPA